MRISDWSSDVCSSDLARAVYDLGDLVGPESNPLTEIISQDPIYVLFPVSQQQLSEPAQEAAARSAGQKHSVVRFQPQSGGEYLHPGRVGFVGSCVASRTTPVPVRAGMQTTERLT